MTFTRKGALTAGSAGTVCTAFGINREHTTATCVLPGDRALICSKDSNTSR